MGGNINDLQFELEQKRVYLAGHRGLVGSAVFKRLQKEKCDIITVEHEELDLTRQKDVEVWLYENRPDVVIIAAARVGGILVNSFQPADFIYDNLVIETNIIHGSWKVGVKKLVFLGSSCIYPKMSSQPIKEESLLSGPLEPTNEWYSIAKIAGVKMIQAYRRQYRVDFISVMPTNLYGPNDNYDLESSHVVPALMRKIHESKIHRNKIVNIWGTGKPKRDFIHVDDLADAIVFLLHNYSGEVPLNIGSGKEISIHELADMIADVIGYEGIFKFDTTKPNGAPRKILDISKISALGWEPRISLRNGLRQTYEWYLRNVAR